MFCLKNNEMLKISERQASAQKVLELFDITIKCIFYQETQHSWHLRMSRLLFLGEKSTFVDVCVLYNWVFAYCVPTLCLLRTVYCVGGIHPQPSCDKVSRLFILGLCPYIRSFKVKYPSKEKIIWTGRYIIFAWEIGEMKNSDRTGTCERFLPFWRLILKPIGDLYRWNKWYLYLFVVIETDCIEIQIYTRWLW